MKICVIPIDNRPVCYDLIKNIVAIDEAIELLIPPIDYLGDLKKTANIEQILDWLNSFQECDAIILSLDTIAYGGLIPSRRSNENIDIIKTRLDKLKKILSLKNAIFKYLIAFIKAS